MSRFVTLGLNAEQFVVDNTKDGITKTGDDYLTKPLAFAELLVRIRALLRRRSPANEHKIDPLPLITGYTGLIIMVVLGFGIYTYFKVDAYLNAALRDSLSPQTCLRFTRATRPPIQRMCRLA